MQKEQEKIDKLEKERLEKEKKEREKKEREEQEKIRKEQEKIKKERDKINAKLEKERKQKEKEENERQKKLLKEREKEIQRQKELEPFISPPYGINNYGNTCYFNSVNQIFFNLPILQQIFLDPKINTFINKDNKFGHQGKFFEIYKSLYWIKYSKVGEVIPKLKALVGKLKEDFNNNLQQDANEYLNFVLESLHEELNLHSTKRYIEEKDDIYKHNTDEEMGNISWSNNLRRNASFIDSIFMFQLKSNLTCRKCKTKKFNFETNYIFDLPLSLCKMVTVEIHLYRLPFRYKLYYDKINKDFDNYLKKDENKNISLYQNLWNYYTNVLTFEEKNNHFIELHFSFDLEREKKMIDITKILRGIKPLELEPENITETYNDDKITEYKLDQLTDFITYSREKNCIIYPYSEIDKYVNMEDKIILNVYEVLNSNGMKKLFEEENNKLEINTYSYLYKKTLSSNIDDYMQVLKDTNFISKDKESENIKKDLKDTNNENNLENQNKSINILSLNEKLSIFPKDEINKETKKTRKVICEFAIPIFHYWRANRKSTFLFREYYHIKISEFPIQYVILNNNYDMTARQLYEYIWNLNIVYMNHPKIKTNNFWWNIKKETLNNEEIDNGENKKNKNINIKSCYPFVLRYNEIPDKSQNFNINLIHCPLCPWYTFCPGCIINPSDDLSKFTSKFGIVVDWCYSFVSEELQPSNFRLYKEIDNQVIGDNLPILDKNQTYQSIDDCFKLFFEEENLEDPLYCHKCQGPEDFSKKYIINKLPYVLILSLKRFKFNQNSNFKLRQMITYPLYNLEVGNDKVKKKYDLYGVVNHYGSINSGHYTAFIKNRNKEWMVCDDSRVYKIDEKKVMHAYAYILFYICQESPYKNDYIKFMKSLMNNIIVKDKKEIINKDLNFFEGEPVITKYGEGYVVKENLYDFKVDENYDIYKDLEREDILRIENLNKKYKKEDKIKKEEKEKEKEKEKGDKNKDKKDKDEKNNKTINENKNEEKKENQNIDNKIQNEVKNEIIENKNEQNKDEKNNNENENKNSDNNQIIESEKENDINEKNIKDNNINNNNKVNEIDKNKEVNEKTQVNVETDTGKNNEIITDGDNNEKDNNKDSQDYYKNFIEIKFDYGKGWIYRKNVQKYIEIKTKKEKEKEKDKEKEKKEEKTKKK